MATAIKILFYLLRTLFLAVLPFVLLLRTALYLYWEYGVSAWVALTGGGLVVFVLLVLYLGWIYKKIFGGRQMSKSILKGKVCIAGGLLLAFCGYMLASFSGIQAKTDSVQEEFQLLHPLLRMGVGMVWLADRDLLVTDVARSRPDYQDMGLATPGRSLHYPQPDGYVHAVDLRTRGRGGLRNWLLKQALWAMGFRTLRHVGTADHLHVSV